MKTALVLVFFVVMLAYLAGMLVWHHRVRDFGRRMPHFHVSRGAFMARPLTPPPLLVMLIAIAAACQAALAPTWHLLVGFLALVAVVALVAWSGSRLTLSPGGISWGAWIFKRHAGWDDLDPGGPARVVRDRATLELSLRGGQERRLSTQTDVSPSLLAGAIRWYAAHPEDRVAIGTETEHTRLLSALGAAGGR